MREIILKSISIRNFKGIAQLDLSFNDNITKIFAENGSGKTTIKIAWEWVLGKNITGYIPEINFKEIPNLETSVEINLSIDNYNYNLKRINKQKYDKAGNKTGNENIYFIDEINVSAKDYLIQVNNLLSNNGINNLQILTDKDFFNSESSSWKWVDRRKLLLSMTGADKQSLNIIELPKYDLIRDYIKKGFSTSDILSTLKKEINQLKDKQKANKVLIDSVESEIKEYLGINFEDISQQLSTTKQQYTKLLKTGIDEQSTNELKQLETSLFNKSKELSNEKTRDMLKIKDLENDKLNIYRKAIEVKSEYDKVVLNIKSKENYISELNKNDIQDVCPICYQKFPIEKINQIKLELENNIKTEENSLNLLKQNAKDLYNQYNDLQTQYNDFSEKIKNFATSPLIQQLEKDINELNLIIADKKKEKSNNLLDVKIKSLEEQISNLQEIMSKKQYLEKGYKQIKGWKDESLKIADDIINVETKENTLKEFMKEQTDIIINTVNSFFKNNISFKLYKENYNGNLEETCVAMYNNIAYPNLSNGEKNYVNMQIVEVLQDFFNVNCVVFSDNAEANTIKYNTSRQIIEFYVKEDTKIKDCVKIKNLYKGE